VASPIKRIMISRAVLRTVAIVWLTLLILGSLQPLRLGHAPVIHRGIHWLGFAGAAFLLFPLSRTRRQEILSAFTAFLIGLSVEVLQHLIYRSSLEWHDITDDGLAIFVAFVLYHLSGAPKVASHPSV
jgi:TRAP-type uncharacterized transport system fused permease subunit